MAKITIEVEQYHTPEGLPTCAVDWEEGLVCQFLRVAGMCGKQEVCVLMNRDLRRSNGGCGFLIPANGCPVHYPAVEEQTND